MIKVAKVLGYLIGLAVQGAMILALVYLSMTILTTMGWAP